MKEKDRTTLFTRRMKKTHTILLPQMLEYHSDFLKAAFEGSGYRLETMREDTGLKDAALRYISSDYCYPAVLIVGQVLKILENGRFQTIRSRLWSRRQEAPAGREIMSEQLCGRSESADGNRYRSFLLILKGKRGEKRA